MSGADHEKLKHYTRRYGDLLFDLCNSLLWARGPAQLAFQNSIRILAHTAPRHSYHDHERAWAIKEAYSQIRASYERRSKKSPPIASTAWDQDLLLEAKLQRLSKYLQRLPLEDQCLLLLKEKHQLPFEEIALILDLTPDALKFKRQQALKTLEEWIWNSP